MKFLIVDRYFYPDLQATSVLLTDIAKELSKNFDIDVLCGPASDFKSAGSKELGNIKVSTVPSTSLDQSSLIGRFINYATFLLMTPFAILFHAKADAVLIGTSPPLLPFVSLFACAFRGFPYVYLCNDYFPNTAVLSGWMKEGFLSRLFKSLNLYSLKKAARVIAIGRDMKELLAKDGVLEDRVDVIPNWADSSEIKPLPKSNSVSSQYWLDRYFVLMHSGNFGLVQDFDFMLQLAEKLQDDDKFRLVFVGGGALRSSVQEKAKGMKLANVVFLDFQPREKLAETLASADLHLVSLKRGLAGNSVPSKTYSLLPSGRPIVGLLEQSSEVARMIQEANCGVVLDTISAGEAADAVKKLAKNPGQLSAWGKNARAYAEKMDFRGNAIRKYREVLREVAGGR